MITPGELDAAIQIFFSDPKNKLYVDELMKVFCESEASKIEMLYLRDQFMNSIVNEGPERMETNVRRLILSSIIFGYCVKETFVDSKGVKN